MEEQREREQWLNGETMFVIVMNREEEGGGVS